MARVNVDSELFSDPRLEILGELTGKGKFDALGRLLSVWHHCYSKTEAVLEQEEIDMLARMEFFAKYLVKSKLADFIGEEKYRIRGAEERFEWLKQRRKAGSKGGKASAQARLKQKPSKGQAMLNPLDTDTDTDIILLNKLSNTDVSNSQPPKCDHKRFAEIWNLNCGTLPKVKTVTEGRKIHVRARWKEKPDLEFWESVVKTIAASPFLCGENDRGWQADFEWMIKNGKNYPKVIEGKYGAKVSQKPAWETWTPEGEKQ